MCKVNLWDEYWYCSYQLYSTLSLRCCCVIYVQGDEFLRHLLCLDQLHNSYLTSLHILAYLIDTCTVLWFEGRKLQLMISTKKHFLASFLLGYLCNLLFRHLFWYMSLSWCRFPWVWFGPWSLFQNWMLLVYQEVRCMSLTSRVKEWYSWITYKHSSKSWWDSNSEI